jgi:DNA-binding NtrC family response regulator
METRHSPETMESAWRRDDRRRKDDARDTTALPAFREAKARAIAEFEFAYVREVLWRAGGNVSLAARLAGKERSRFNRLVRKYRIVAREFRRPADASVPVP